METLREILDPHFLLRNSVYIGLLIGLICPLVGIFLVVRRLIFMGVALPQVSSCGIAFAFALHSWHLIPHLEESSEHGLALVGASVFTLGTLVLLAFLDRKQRGSTEGRIGTVYVLAGAWSILLLLKNPFGEHGLLERLQGKIIAVSNFDLGLTAIIFFVVLLCLIWFQKELLLVSYRSRNGAEPGQTSGGLGWLIVRDHRPCHFTFRFECRPGGDLWFFDFASFDRQELCAHDATVLHCVLAARSDFVPRGFLARL